MRIKKNYFLFVLLIDRNNGNWLVKYEVKTNNERDMVSAKRTVIVVHTLDITRILFLLLLFFDVFFSVSLQLLHALSSPQLQPEEQVTEYSSSKYVYITNQSLFIIFYIEKNNSS